MQVFMMDRYYNPIKDIVGVENSKVAPKGLANIKPLVGPNKHQTQAWIDALQRRGYSGNVARLPAVAGIKNTVLLQPWCEAADKMVHPHVWSTIAREAVDNGQHVRIAAPASYSAIANIIKKDVPEVENYCGKDKGRWAQTVSEAETVISVDSGAAHLADALGKRGLTMFRSTNPNKWAPFWNRNVIVNPTPKAAAAATRKLLNG